jgi:hypothetical protein
VVQICQKGLEPTEGRFYSVLKFADLMIPRARSGQGRKGGSQLETKGTLDLRAQKTDAEVKLLRLKYAIEREKVLKKEDVRAEIGKLVSSLSRKFDSLPGPLAVKFAGKPVEVAEAAIKKELDKLKRDLASLEFLEADNEPDKEAE